MDPRSHASMPPPDHASSSPLRCCCGRRDCAYLEHNTAALDGLEKDVATAALLGQALLHRHETYMAESEEDRSRLLASVEKLERDKREMQTENARIIEENRGLVEQLEGLNKQVAESDSTIRSLTATLESTQFELRRLTVSAARAEELEAQLSAMEMEQMQLQEQVVSTQEDERSAVQRWKKAECTLRDLHDQVERIEKEAREEREKHAELMERMERRRAVERELDGAAGRLKGAAAASGLGRNQNRSNVVSHFVRDILQDNANLQMGVVELREMLQSSNEEVQNLRDQILLHQPLTTQTDNDPNGKQKRMSLSDELEAKTPRRISQEFHVHHHYHSPTASVNAKKEKVHLNRRPKKKRAILGSPATLQTVSGTQTPPRRPTHRHASTSSTSTILSQTSVTIPPSASHRWSLQSPATTASIASSPTSGYRTSSIFDRMEHGFESSQPTSPESNAYSSPLMGARHQKRPSDASLNSIPGQAGPEQSLGDELAHLESQNLEDMQDDMEVVDGVSLQPAIPEETEESSGPDLTASDTEHGYGHDADESAFSSSLPFHAMRKSTSHESLLSVSGMDIHTLRDRPSQLRGLHSTYFARLPRRIVSPSTELSSTPPIISTANITADRVSLGSASHMSSHSLLASVAAHSHPRTVAPSIASQESSDGDTATPIPGKASTFGRRVGGWVLGRWGVAPVTSTSDLRAQAAMNSAASGSSASSILSSATEPSKPAKPKPDLAPPGRIPGVNQRGPIPGLRPPARTPSQVHAKVLDEELLRESLAET